MSTTDKPYRRFRARGSRGDGGMEELHRLVEAERGGAAPRGAGAPRAARPAPAPRPAGPPPVASSPPVSDEERRRRRALERAGRRWWSLRGLGPAGWVGRIALVLALALVVWGIAGFFTLRSAVSESNSRIQRGVPGALSPSKGMLGNPTNVLIVGSDALPGQTRSRADTILVMRMDPDSGRIKYLSIPRDFRVYMGPRLGNEKINAAFAVGGQAGIIRAVRRLTGLPIHHLIVVNFRGFPRLVDELGGVTVDNPTAITDCPYPGGRRVSFPTGRVELDGAEALVFVRVRKCDGDFARGARQQALLAALRREVLSPWSLWKAPWSGADMVRALTTDMGVQDLAKFGWLQARLTQRPEDRVILAGETQTIGGISYVVGDPDRDLEQIREFVSRD